MVRACVVVVLAACTSAPTDPFVDGSDTSPTSVGTTPDPTGTSTSTPGVDAPTWYEHVAPLLADRCGACHVQGGIGPFSVATYASVRPWGFAIDNAVQSGAMPPFFASNEDCAMPQPLLDDVRLTQAEKDLVSDWVDADMPEGDPALAVPAPLRQAELLDPVDATVRLEQPFTIGGTRDVYQCFRIPLGLTDDVWVTGVQVLPDNDLVVHHVLVWTDPEDQSHANVGPDGSYPCSGFPGVYPTSLIGAWTPGANPARTPEGTGISLTAGSSLVVNVHYHPTGTTDEVDQTSIQLQFATSVPAREALYYLVDLPFGSTLTTGPDFSIPAGASAHVEASELTLPAIVPDLSIFAVGPHMHYLGTDMKVTVNPGAPSEQCLVHTPGYRFDWQRSYTYDAPIDGLPVVGRGDRIGIECTYDNSPSNPFLADNLAARGADAPEDVTWGEETGDEMCMAIVGFILP